MGSFAAILNLIPGVVSLIQVVEGLFTKGSDKKTAVVNSATAILTVLQTAGIVTPDVASKYPAAVSNLTDAIVTFMNAIGVFPTTTTTVTKS